ncbi:MAG TPA: hypothetical protein VK629_05995 [Steroidobacteraceae bacterium]|nr:hypothetical protein [Steroidobacteraceae bacterium]
MNTNLNLKSVRSLAALIESQRVAEKERAERRAFLVTEVQRVRKEGERLEVELVAKAAPLEKQITQLRVQLTAAEEELAPLATARAISFSSSAESVRLLQKELRADADEEVRGFQRVVERARDEINSNGSLQAKILAAFRVKAPKHERLTEAMALTLAAYRAADKVALEEQDVSSALDRLSEGLAAEGIDVSCVP